MLSPLLQKLLFVKQFSIYDGKVNVLGSDYIMLDASLLVVLQDIDKTKMYNRAKSSTKEQMKELVDHAQVYKNIKEISLSNIADLAKKVSSSDAGLINSLQDIFNIFGLGKLEIVNLDNAKKQALVRVHESGLARAYLKKSKVKTKICALTAGILAGLFSFVFKKSVDCMEDECIAQGKDVCSFSIG